MKQKNRLISYDYYILAAFAVLVMIGMYFQLDISSIRSNMGFFYRQSFWLVLSIAFLVLAYKIDLDKVRKLIPLLLFLTVVSLVLVLIFGKEVKGAKRFLAITIPFIRMTVNFQPSLMARIVLIFYFAHFLDKNEKFIPLSKLTYFFKKFNALIVVPGIILILILFERHFSPLVISVTTLLSLLFLAKIRMSTILTFSAIFILIGMGIVILGPKYRAKRMMIYKEYSLFMKSDGTESSLSGDDGYQIKQSLISLESGGLFGTGVEKGTGRHYFLPEAKTDYVFSIIGEEWGFIGALIVLSLFVFLFVRTMISSYHQDSLFLMLSGMGLGMNIFYNAMVNIGVAISALPSTGVTLPFISYGGTSLLINSITIGLILNISSRRRGI